MKSPKPRRIPTAVGQILNVLENHRENIYFSLAYLSPPIDDAEMNKLAYVAEEALKALEAEYGPRGRMIVPMMMHYRVISSCVAFFEKERSKGNKNLANIAAAEKFAKQKTEASIDDIPERA